MRIWILIIPKNTHIYVLQKMNTKNFFLFLLINIINMQNFTLISNRGNKKLSSHETAKKFDKSSLQKCLRITFLTPIYP
jgi:hypothetical protein